MFGHYLLSAWRNIQKDTISALVNFVGLSMGLMAALLIVRYIDYHTSFDEWLPQSERIFKLQTRFHVPGSGPFGFASSPGVAAPAMQSAFPAEVEATTRLFRRSVQISTGPDLFIETLTLADASFFDVFKLPLRYGNREGLLADSNSIVLSAEMAEKYFGNEVPVGKVLTMDGERDYTVSGVLEPIPENTHLSLALLALFDPLRFSDQPHMAQQWSSASSHSYFRLANGVSPEAIEAGIPAIVDRNSDFRYPGAEDVPPSELIRLDLIPVTDIHLRSELPGEFKAGGNIIIVNSLAVIAVLILLIAVINYSNLALVGAVRRSREVTIRRVHGATRGHFLSQFLIEAVLLTLLSTGAAIGLAHAVGPAFAEIANTDLSPALGEDLRQWGWVVAILAGVSLLCGGYPAVAAASFKPAEFLVYGNDPKIAGIRLRGILIGLQFGISISLLIVTAILYLQTSKITGLDIGFESEGKLVLRGLQRDRVASMIAPLRRQIMALPGVRAATTASSTIPLASTNTNNAKLLNSDVPERGVESIFVGLNFFTTMNIAPVAGRVFEPDRSSDLLVRAAEGQTRGRASIIVNEAFLSAFDISGPRQALGAAVHTAIGRNGPLVEAEIIGVVENLRLHSVKRPVAPMAIAALPHDEGRALIVDIGPLSNEQALEAATGVWRSLLPEDVMLAGFIADNVDRLYRDEQNALRLLGGFAVFTTSVALLGIYGMSRVTVNARRRDVAVRKVFGADWRQLTLATLLRVSAPVLLTSLVALPLTFVLLSRWLQGYSVRIDLWAHIPVFLAVAVFVVLLSWLAITTDVVRLARLVPAKVLHER